MSFTDFLERFFDALGVEGMAIILICIFLFGLCQFIQNQRKWNHLTRERNIIKKYHKLYDDGKTKQAEEFRKKNKDAFYF